MKVHKIRQRSGIDQLLNYRRTFYKVSELIDQFQIDTKWLDSLTEHFCSFEAAVQFAQLKYDGYMDEVLSQNYLIKLFLHEIYTKSAKVVAIKLHTKVSKINNFYYKLSRFLNADEELMVLSLGMGMLFAALLSHAEQERLRLILLNAYDINIYDYKPKSENELLWEL